MAVKVAVVLSGCGVSDGSEIHEATLTLLHLAHAGADVTCVAPNIAQHDVMNHQTGQQAAGEARNVLVESARICRGPVSDISTVKAADFDAIIFPGGFGAAKNISNFALVDSIGAMHVQPAVHAFVTDAFKQHKPLGFMCISPAAVAAVALAGKGIRLTIGTDVATADKIEALGNVHEVCAVDDIVYDETHHVVSTPAYMTAQNIAEADAGIRKLVAKVMDMCHPHQQTVA